MPLGIGRNRDHHIAVNNSYPRTSQITTTPSKALTIPAIRSSPSGVSSAVAASRLARPGSAAKINPSIARTRPTATRKSRIAPARCRLLFGRADASLAVRIREEAEEIRVRPQQQARIGLLQSLLVSLHGAVEREELRVLAIGLGEDAIALGVAVAADALGRRGRLRRKHSHVAVSLGADLLRAPAAFGAELRSFLLALGLHALIDRQAVLLGQIG